MERVMDLASDRIELTSPAAVTPQSRHSGQAGTELPVGRAGRSLREARAALHAAQALVDQHLCESLSELTL